MPVKVSCPKCNAQYQIPEKVLGKVVKCKSCGAAFKTPAPSANQLIVKQQNNTQLAVQSSQPSAKELARYGIDGPIKKQADIFATPPPNPRANPLGNFVLPDPGFAEVQPAGEGVGDVLNGSNDDDGMAAILNNPYAKKKEKKKKRPTGFEELDGPSGGKKKKGKKGKRKIHPAVKDSLDQATMTLLVIGVLILSLFGFMMYNADHDAMAAMNNAGVEEAGIDAEDAAEFVASSMKWVYGAGMVIGAIFVGFAFGVQVFPITCSLLALIFYMGLELIMMILNPFSIMSMFGWLRRIVICVALGKAFMDALNARSHSKMMAARGK